MDRSQLCPPHVAVQLLRQEQIASCTRVPARCQIDGEDEAEKLFGTVSDDFWLILGGPPRWISGSSPIVRSPIYRWENSRIGDLRSPGLQSSYWDDPGMVDMVVVSGRRNQALVFGVVESPAGFLAAHFKVWKAMHSDIDHLAVLDRGMHRKSCLRMGSAKRSRSHLLQIEYPRVI